MWVLKTLAEKKIDLHTIWTARSPADLANLEILLIFINSRIFLLLEIKSEASILICNY